MSARTQTTSAATIQLNDTFLRLVSGAATMEDIITERQATRAATIAREDAATRCRREWAETRDFFFRTCAY